MKEQRKNRKISKVLFLLYLTVCLGIIISAYFRLSQIARDFNTQHLELITGLYAEKMNTSMEYLQNYAQEDVTMIQSMEDQKPAEILQHLRDNLDQTLFCNIGLILKNQKILGNPCDISDIQKKCLDQTAKDAKEPFFSDPYRSTKTGNMVLTIFVPVSHSDKIQTLFMSIRIENLRQLGVYDLLRDKISVYLLKADSENFITCISTGYDMAGNWNNLLLQQKYFRYTDDYSYHQWVKDMQAGEPDGRFSAEIRGEASTISYRSITNMPGWYVIVELTNRNVSNITQNFSVWGGIYGSILVGFTILYMLTIVFLEKKEKKRYMGLSTTDPLTGLMNRRAFQRTLESELRSQKPGIFIFIDVDNFKNYNDRYGHNVGDLCLTHFARTMGKSFPDDSILGRYGGDEFVVYLKNASSESAQQYMLYFQEQVAHMHLPSGETIELSASAGGAAFPEQGEDFISLCRSADMALYDVKRNGKAAFKMKGH